MKNYMSFGHKLKQLRKKKGMSAEQFAEAIGRSPKMVSKYENGTLPSTSTLLSICKILGTTPHILLSDYLDETIPEKDSNIHEIFLLISKLTPNELHLVEDTLHIIMKNRK